MKELKCPKCGTMFTVDEADFETIVSQVRNQEFAAEVAKREQEIRAQYATREQLAKQQAEMQLQQSLAAKASEIEKQNSEINVLKAQLASIAQTKEAEKQAALLAEKQCLQELLLNKEAEIARLKADMQKQLGDLQNAAQLQAKQAELNIKQLNDEHRILLEAKQKEVDFYKDFKAKMSTKMLGETLEQHCAVLFEKNLRPMMPTAYFEKDNDTTQGTKGDFIFRDKVGEQEYISIMFEMKNEADTTATKHSNEKFFEKLDEDRKAYYLLIAEYTDPATLNLLKGKFQIKKTKEPNNVYWSYYYGLVLENNRLFRDAIEQYQTCKRINASTLFDEQIAYCYSKMGDFERALEYVNYVITVDSTDADYYEQRANIYGEMGNRAKAIEDLTKYIEFYPEYSYAYYRRGWYKHLDLQHEAAIEDFNLSIMLDSTYNYAYDGRGRSYMALGKTDLAKADFEKILSFDTIPNGNSCAPSAYHFLGNDSLAIDFIRRTLQEDSTANYDAACTFALANQVDRAVFYLRKAFEHGFVRLHHISVDMDFDAIRNDERFISLVEKYTQKIQEANNNNSNENSAKERVVEVPFTAANGVTKVNCTINGLPLNFVFDTGASDVTISQVEANFMFKNGYLSEKDIVGKQHYQTADGNISVGTVINLNSINFGGLSLNNIRASVVQSQNAPLLLGQSVLQHLGKIEIDNSQRILKITTKQ